MQKESNYKKWHTEWAGVITPNDFDTEKPNSKKIKREKEAKNFNAKIKEPENQEPNYFAMTWEELHQLGVISTSTGRPSDSLTDEKWQLEFKIRKFFTVPHHTKTKRLKGCWSQKFNEWNDEKNGEYKGDTNWQNYCWYINDVLKNIESKHHDYCYYLYQVIELLKFYPDSLKTKYCKYSDDDGSGYWEVWLDR